MIESARKVLAAFGVALCAMGCSQEPSSSSRQDSRASSSELMAASPYEAFALAERTKGLEVLEVARDGRAVAGTAAPVPPRSSAKLSYEAVYVDRDGRRRPLPFATRIQDARFAFPPSPLLAVLDDADVLRVWNTATGDVREIDQDVFPGFGFSHAGTALVYAKGLAPELDAYSAPLPSGAPRRLTSAGVPVWGFAFSPDDTRIVYVDAPDGFPCLTTMPAGGGARERLTNRALNPGDLNAGATLAPFPDGRRPPLWLGEHVVVQDTQGVHAIDKFGNVVRTYPHGRDLHLDTSGRSAMFRLGDVVHEVGR